MHRVLEMYCLAKEALMQVVMYMHLHVCVFHMQVCVCLCVVCVCMGAVY